MLVWIHDCNILKRDADECDVANSNICSKMLATETQKSNFDH